MEENVEEFWGQGGAPRLTGMPESPNRDPIRRGKTSAKKCARAHFSRPSVRIDLHEMRPALLTTEGVREDGSVHLRVGEQTLRGLL